MDGQTGGQTGGRMPGLTVFNLFTCSARSSVSLLTAAPLAVRQVPSSVLQPSQLGLPLAGRLALQLAGERRT